MGRVWRLGWGVGFIPGTGKFGNSTNQFKVLLDPVEIIPTPSVYGIFTYTLPTLG